jgi:hypothetical protein
MDRLHNSPAIDAGSTSRRADLINEVALGFPDIESREPSIDPGISCHIDHKRINDRRNRGVSAKPVVPILPCRYPLRSRTASQNHRNTESSHPSPQHRLLCYMAPAFFANKPFAGVNVIAPPKSLLQSRISLGFCSYSCRTYVASERWWRRNAQRSRSRPKLG